MSAGSPSTGQLPEFVVRPVTAPALWQVEGSYFEACNCDAVCPCRRQGNRPGGRATYGVCDFALSWLISRGRADDLDLSGFEVVLAGSFDADEPGSPWRVALYVDERADRAQHAALADIFLGRAGGTTWRTSLRRSARCTRCVPPASVSITPRAGSGCTSTTTWRFGPFDR